MCLGGRRRRRQILRAADRLLRDLPSDDRHPRRPPPRSACETALMDQTTPRLQSSDGSGDDITAIVARRLSVSRRGHPLEVVFWLVPLAASVLMPTSLPIINEVAILGLFALSLDLILGYAGIVSLGHAAFLGLGAYAAGIFAKHGAGDPLLGLAVAAFSSAVLGCATSFLVLRGSDLTRLMVTLGLALVLYELANNCSALTVGPGPPGV